MPTRAFRVMGRVQGVGFRWWTRGRAEALGLAGSVRNLADGSVEVIARGDDDRLDLLRNALEKGPPGAAVESVEVSPAPPLAATGFEIVR